jgi:iron complex transport system substrate-binding protein
MAAERSKGMNPTVIVVILVVAVAAAFGGGYAIGSITNASNQQHGFSFVDDYNRTVSLDGYPQRIVSVAPTPTEMLFAVGAGDLIVGLDAWSDYPAQTNNITKVGDFELNLEQIITLKPDLIISGDLVPQADLDTLESNGIPYMIIADRSLSDVYGSIQLVGNVTNHASNASLLIESLKERVGAVTNKTLANGISHPKVYIEYWPMFTFGPGSFGDDIIRLAGGANIGAIKDTEYPSVTDEFVVSQNPDIIVYTTGPSTTTNSTEIMARPGWNQTNAVSHSKIYSIDDNLVSRYGPRIIDGLEQLAAFIHPELFT